MLLAMHYGLTLVGGCVLVLAGVLTFWRWLRRKPKHIKVPGELLEEMTRFADELEELEESIKAVTHELTLFRKRVWHRTSRRIVRRLRSVNDLLEHLNMLFEEHGLGVRRRREAGGETGSADGERPKDVHAISDEEIRNIDWDEFNRRALG
ncbi:MAG: hypothetical protein V2A58_00300 [Planctomycetota bacterium]